jgi:Condensation domain
MAGDDGGREEATPGAPGPGALPLSVEQEWFVAARIADPNQRYSVVQAFDLDGPLDIGLFASSLNAVVSRHEGMRVRLAITDRGEPVQAVTPASGDVPVSYQAVACRSRGQFEAYARGMARADLTAKWSPVGDPLYRLRVLRRSQTEHILLSTFDHLAFDMRALATFTRDLWLAYANDGQVPEEITGPPGSLALALQRQRERHGRRCGTVNARYWAKRLAVAPPIWQIPGAQHGALTMVPAQSQFYPIGVDRATRLQSACRRMRCSVFELCVSVFAWLVFQLTRQQRLAIYVPLDTRGSESHDVIGMFSGVCPLVLDRAAGGPPAFLGQVKKEVFKALLHRPVLAAAENAAVMSQQARWQMMPQRSLALNYMKGEEIPEVAGCGDLRVNLRRYAPLLMGRAAALGLIIFDYGSKLSVALKYAPGLFPDDMADGLLKLFTEALDGFGDERPGRDLEIGPGSRPAEPSGRSPTPLYEADGAVCLHVDLDEVRAAILAHPAVTAAEVRVERAAGGPSEVVAYLDTVQPVADDEIRAACSGVPGASQYLIPPARISQPGRAAAGPP